MIDITNAVIPLDASAYAIEVSACSNNNKYTGTVTNKVAFTFNVNKKSVNSISNQKVINTVLSSPIVSVNITKSPAAVTGSFSITSDITRNTALSFDSSTGRISGTSDRLSLNGKCVR